MSPRCKILISALVLLLASLQLGTATSVPVTPASLRFTLYSDGLVQVDYSIVVDSQQARVNTTLFGKSFSNVLVTNERGVSLDSSIVGKTIIIDTLGSNRTLISYVTSDLTNKTGQLWTFRANAAINSTIILPRDSTIISLNFVPLTIGDISGQVELVVPSGLTEISYTVVQTVTPEQAQTAIINANTAITKAQSERRTAGLQEAVNRNKQAREQFGLGNYSQALELALAAKSQADAATIPKGSTSTTTPAALPTTTPLAPESPTSTSSSPSPAPPAVASQTATPATVIVQNIFLIGGIIAAVAVVSGLAFFFRGKAPREAVQLPPRQKRSMDVDKILAEFPQLRLDDREVIQFIGESGGEAFEAEIRERFKLPKTTVWRMITRLKKEGLVDVQKVGGQNLVRLKQKFEREQESDE